MSHQHERGVNVKEGFKDLWDAAWPVALVLFGFMVLGAYIAGVYGQGG